MAAAFTTWAAAIRRLCEALGELRPRAAAIGVEWPERAEWCQLLEHKLRPQTVGTPPLVVAIVGGTNIGKSALFNQLAGEDASAVSPMAAGTKHPVCLAPADAADEKLLRMLFPGFTLRAWSASDDALGASDDDFLFWRTSNALPPRLLLLDTPDVDSDAQVNWRRADIVRQTADVLIAVLTQQKYNDAAVKKFFRHAAEADKAVMLVYNQVDLALDREVWPAWTEVFCRETGVRPVQAFVVPYDRGAAGRRELTFYGVGVDGRDFSERPIDLRHELSELRYDELKTRTLRGALRRTIDPREGVPHYLTAVRAAADQFAAARRAIAEAHRVTTSWPGLPPGILVDEVSRWWDERRSPWSRRVHGFYNRVGGWIARPIKRLWTGPTPAADPLTAYRQSERNVIVEGIARLLDELDRLASVGNEILRPRLKALLGGTAREEHLRRIQAAYDRLPPIDDDFRALVDRELQQFVAEHPRAAATFRSLDAAAAVARPAITVSLALTGILIPGDVVLGSALAHAAGHTAGEVAAAVVVAGGGEAVVGAAGKGIKHAAGQLFRKLQADHAAKRAAALTEIFQRELLGDLLAELEHGAQTAAAPEFTQAVAAAAGLGKLCDAQ